MASIMKRGNAYSVRYTYTDHRGKPCHGWETFNTKKEAQERKITVEKELQDGTFPCTRFHDGRGNALQVDSNSIEQTQMGPQDLLPDRLDGAESDRAIYWEAKGQDLRTYDIEQFYATLSRTPCGQYVKGEKQKLSDEQKKRLLSSTSIHEVHTLLKTAFSYAVEWDLVHKSPLPRDAPKVNTEERTIWDEHTMLAALQTMDNPALHLAVHLSMILSLREGEILGLQPEDLNFDAADGRDTVTVSRTMQRASKGALAKIDPAQIYHTFPDRREAASPR